MNSLGLGFAFYLTLVNILQTESLAAHGLVWGYGYIVGCSGTMHRSNCGFS